MAYDVPRVLITAIQIISTGLAKKKIISTGDFQFDQQLYEGLTKKKKVREEEKRPYKGHLGATDRGAIQTIALIVTIYY